MRNGGIRREGIGLGNLAIPLWVCAYLFVGARVLDGGEGYRWHPIKESAGHPAVERSSSDPIGWLRVGIAIGRMRA